MDSELAGLAQDVRFYKAMQKLRLGLGERIRSTVQGRSDLDIGRYEGWYKSLFAVERQAKAVIEKLAGQHPLWEGWLCDVRGVGKLTLAQLLGEIGTVKGHNGHPGIGAFDVLSKLWKFCGLAPGQKRVKGEKLSYNARLKTACLEFVGGGIIRANGAYRRLYDERKAYTQANRDPEQWSPLRIHYDARRVMVKVWLSHFWQKYRELEGYPAPAPYVFDILGHTHRYGWEEFLEPLSERKPTDEREPLQERVPVK